ncbi:MAG: hypothetical protein ACREGH_00835 [Minisyncoccia bacterium]
MKKFFVLYRVPIETMREWRTNTKPEEMKTQGEKMMHDMAAWTEKNSAALVDRGQPLGRNKRVTSVGIEDTPNDLNYYCIVEAESPEAAAALFADNPHPSIPTSFIDIMEITQQGM